MSYVTQRFLNVISVYRGLIIFVPAVASVTVEETADPGRVQPMPSPLVGIVFPKTPSAAATGTLGDSLPYVSGEIWLSLDIGDAYGTLWTPITLIAPDQDR